ncbi:TPA: phage tail protein [Vibrio cholerae]
MSNIHRVVPLSLQMEQTVERLKKVRSSSVPIAISKTINAVGMVSERNTAKDVSKTERLKQKSIRARLVVRQKSAPAVPVRIVKVRRHPMAVSAVGKPRKTKRGVTVGRHRFDSAFVADGSKGFGKYIPAAKRSNRSQAYHPTRLKSEQVFTRSSKARYPIEVVTIPIAEPLTEAYERSVRRAYNQEFPRSMAKNLETEFRKLKLGISS